METKNNEIRSVEKLQQTKEDVIKMLSKCLAKGFSKINIQRLEGEQGTGWLSKVSIRMHNCSL